MLKIRLSRVGKKNQPSYRVVIADARANRDGAYVDIVGHYNPRTEPTTFEVDADKVRNWLSKGAQPTERVEKLLSKQGLVPAKDWGAASAAAAAKREANRREPRAAAPPAPAATAVAEPVAPPAAEAPSAAEAPAEEPSVAEAAAEEAPAAEAESTVEAEAEPESAPEVEEAAEGEEGTPS